MSTNNDASWPNAGAAMKLIQGIADGVNIYGSPEEFLESFSRLPRHVGHLFAAFWCDSEVRNGGFHQFFSNSTGVLAPEALVSFDQIGLADHALVVAEAIALFGAEYPRDCDQRGELLAKLERHGKTRREWDPFHALDQRYRSASGWIFQSMDQYAETGNAFE